MNNPTRAEELEGTLGEGIRAARLRQNISQADIAGVALGSLRNLENGAGATKRHHLGQSRASVTA